MSTSRDSDRRAETIAALRALAAEVRARNVGLTEEEAEQLADEITRAAIDSLVRQGQVRFVEAELGES